MFTGIVQETGIVKHLEKRSGLWKLGISAGRLYDQARVSDSISVNGVCLTVVEKKTPLLFFEAVKPTVELTNLKRLRHGSEVNLEPALKTGDRLGGHYVLGHVDCEARIKKIGRGSGFRIFDIEYPNSCRNMLVDKGSIAVNGISLTVAKVDFGYFTVNIIPHTYEHTVLRTMRAGDWVNLEFDYLLKSSRTQ